MAALYAITGVGEVFSRSLFRHVDVGVDVGDHEFRWRTRFEDGVAI